MRYRNLIGSLAALALIAAPASAQRTGGGGGGGGGGGAPAAAQPNLPDQSDFTGPISVDSLKLILKDLDADQVSTLTIKREALKFQTAALRDSLGRAAVAMGYVRATKPVPETEESTKAFVKMYDKLLDRVRKTDCEYYNKTVKPLLTKPQQKIFSKWNDFEVGC